MRRLAACVSPGAVRVDRTLWEGYNQDAGLEMACVWLCAPTTSSDRRGNFSPSRAGTFSTSHPASLHAPALRVNGFLRNSTVSKSIRGLPFFSASLLKNDFLSRRVVRGVMRSRRRVAVVRGVQHAVFHRVTERAQRLQERGVRLALVTLQRAAIRAERPPAPELGEVLNENRRDVELLRPLQDVPGRRARLVVNRASATRRRVMRAFRTRHQEIQAAARHDGARVDAFDRFTEMVDTRMIEAVGVDGGRPVIDGEQLQLEAQLLHGAHEAGARPTRPAEEVHRLDAFHCGDQHMKWGTPRGLKPSSSRVRVVSASVLQRRTTMARNAARSRAPCRTHAYAALSGSREAETCTPQCPSGRRSRLTISRSPSGQSNTCRRSPDGAGISPAATRCVSTSVATAAPNRACSAASGSGVNGSMAKPSSVEPRTARPARP